jgi:hypothetical protein
MAARKVSSDLETSTGIVTMIATSHTSTSDIGARPRNVVFVLLGIAVFLLKRPYSGPLQEIVHAYAGNLSISFALYFVFMNLQPRLTIKRLVAASLAFAAVELFEAFNGFGVMANTYDPVDFVVNAVGISFALSLDMLLGPSSTKDRKTESL